MSRTNTVRIIGGKWRGRKVSFAPVPGLRPSPDRVRETLFNWLQWEVQGANVLEPYAGSGILSLEALSRDAAHATVIDTNPQVARQLSEVGGALAGDSLTVKTGKASAILPHLATVFDLVLLDPPFDSDEMAHTLSLLAESNLLADDAVIYLESGTPLSQFKLPAGYSLVKEKRAGQVHFGIARPTMT